MVAGRHGSAAWARPDRIIEGIGDGPRRVGADEEPEIYWCATSFAEFAYRFWLEYRLSRAEGDGVARADLPPELAGYRYG